MKKISVVVPVYFEEAVIGEFYRRLTSALQAMPARYDYEVVFVNDGSTDNSLRQLLELARRDEHLGVIDLSRNFGHQAAITAGIDAARGDAVIVIDADLQDPPEVIAEMVAKWEEGYGVVYGQRRSRAGESALKLHTASVFYRLLNRLSSTPLPLDTGDFRLMGRLVVDTLCAMREETRYMRGMVTWVGFKQCALPYDRDARYAGETKYTFGKMIALALSGITSFSTRPLTLAVNFGAFVTVLSVLALVWIVGNRVFGSAAETPGWASLTVIVLFLGGVQLMSIGVLGEYLGRVFLETKRRPLYVVAGSYGFPALRRSTCPTCGGIRDCREQGNVATDDVDG